MMKTNLGRRQVHVKRLWACGLVALTCTAVIVLFYTTHDRTPTHEDRSHLRNHFPQTPHISEESLTRERGVALENESTPAIPTDISKKAPVVPSKRITEEEPFISVTDNRLTLWIQGRRLGWVLDQIARRSGIPIFHDEGIANQVLSMTLQDTAFDEGLREILSGYDMFILYGGEQVAPVAIWVYPELYLPPYSPNLNLIERLWKFVKKHCLYSKHYADFTAFTHAIEDCLAHTQTTHKQALSSLLTFNFQSFKKVQSLNV